MRRAVSPLCRSTTLQVPTPTRAKRMPKKKPPVPQNQGDDAGYEVGYGRPPTHSQFRPGQSGNPAGRRQGVRNLQTDVMRTLRTPIKVKEGGRSRTKSTQEGV